LFGERCESKPREQAVQRDVQLFEMAVRAIVHADADWPWIAPAGYGPQCGLGNDWRGGLSDRRITHACQ
jgi:hypothetical protein